jgi:hypothetical protein
MMRTVVVGEGVVLLLAREINPPGSDPGLHGRA